MLFGKNKKDNSGTYGYYKGSKSVKSHTILDLRKTIGNRLSFAATEAYKLLRTNLTFSLADESNCKIIGVTSALRGEGKSTTSMNLAYVLAETNKRVLLLEADMRIPLAAKTLLLEETPGLSNVLAGVSQLSEAVQGPVMLKTLYVLAAGDIPPNPSELLSSKRMEQVVKTLTESFDYIIIDLPPVNAVSDSLVVSQLISGMVMVVRKNYCDQHALAEAMRQMEFLKVKVLGFVMNCTGGTGSKYKKYGHSYKYKQEGYGYRQPPSDKKPDSADKTGE